MLRLLDVVGKSLPETHSPFNLAGAGPIPLSLKLCLSGQIPYKIRPAIRLFQQPSVVRGFQPEKLRRSGVVKFTDLFRCYDGDYTGLPERDSNVLVSKGEDEGFGIVADLEWTTKVLERERGGLEEDLIEFSVEYFEKCIEDFFRDSYQPMSSCNRS